MNKEIPDKIEIIIKACESDSVAPELDLLAETPPIAKALEIIKDNIKK